MVLVGSLLYTGLALAAARLFAGHLAWSWREAEWAKKRHDFPSLYGDSKLAQPSGEQWFGGWCVALCVCAVWPLAILPWIVGRRTPVGAEATARSRAAQERVAELERELGIR